MNKFYQAVRKRAKTFQLLILAVLFAGMANAQIFSNTIVDPNPSNFNPFVLGQVVDPNVTASGIGRGSGINANAGADRYNANNWSATFDASDYFTFTITPNSGYLVNFTQLQFTFQRSGTGANAFALRSSQDGFTSNIATGTYTGTSTSAQTFSLAAAAFQNVNAAIEFRLYCWGASGAGGTSSINDFSFTGTVAQAPFLTATPLTGFGDICINTTPGSNTFDITGTNLTAANVTVGPLTGYQFSTNNATFFNSLSIAHAPGAFSQTIYVRFNPTLVQTYNGNIPVGGGGATTIQVPVTGSGVNTAPNINVGVVSGITTNSATVTVTVISAGCTPITAYGIEYSTTPGFANGTGIQVPSVNLAAGVYSVNLTGLVPPGTTFYFHTYATNAGGTTYGAENSFTLVSTTPQLNVPASGPGSLPAFGNLCINSAVGNASFSLTGSLLNGSNVVVGPLAGYTFATNPLGPFSASRSFVNGGSGYTYSGGNLNATVYVRFVPTLVQSYNGNIPVSGGGATAITVAATGAGINTNPSLTTENAIFIGTDGATLPATVNDPGCGAIISYGFEYSTVNGFTPGTGTAAPSSNLSGSSFSLDLNGLAANTTYYYYAYISNANGIFYGAINSFVTGTIPTALMIEIISPASPIALAPFSIKVTAVDNLVDRTPVNVTSNTAVNITRYTGGANVLTPPATPAGVIPTGGSSIIIPGFLYSAPEVGVGIRAVRVSGMALANSQDTTFDVVAYTGPSTFVWNSSINSAWLTNTNWFGPPVASPGAAGNGTVNNHLASFTSQSTMQLTALGGVGINMNTVGGFYNLGALYLSETYNGLHTSGFAAIGNSSTSINGTLTLHGAPLNNVGGIAGNNHSSLLIGNYMNTAGTTVIDIRNQQASGSRFMTLQLASSGSMVIGTGRSVLLSLLLTGTADKSVTVTGGGNLTLTPSGAGTVNTYAGSWTIANGSITAGTNGAFKNTAPGNIMTLGSNPALAGKLRMNGYNVFLGGLNSVGTAGAANSVDNGNASATLTINTASATSYDFGGALINGSSGVLNLTKTGGGTQILSGANTYTGLTTVSQGTLILSRPGGSTLPAGNNVTVTNGTFRVSSDQSLSTITLNTNGRLTVDAGVTLIITGDLVTSAAPCYIVNNGTIILRGSSLQTFPNLATLTSMNNLVIWNNAGVNMNANINVGGVLTLTSGIFTVGPHTLTLNNPIAATVNNLSANNTSSITIAGTASGVNIPASVSQLKNLTVTNTSGTTLQGNLNVNTAVLISASGAGVVNDGGFVFDGTANLTMTSGTLYLQQNGAELPGFTGLYSLNNGTVTFAGTGTGVAAQTIRPLNYFNLTSVLTGDRILGTSGVIGVGNVFTPNTNAYTIVNSTVDFFRAGAQNIPSFTFYNVRISGGGSFTKSLAGAVTVTNRLSMAANTRLALSTHNLTLRSDINGTASVDEVPTDNSFVYNSTGRFVVERFIPTGVNHGKGWQLLGAASFGQTVRQSWQEGAASSAANPNPGYGIQLTSDLPGATALGFDIGTPAGTGSGIKQYDPVAGNWVGIPNTTSTLIADKRGYMVFVRGDRSITSSAAAANPVTLRSTGRIYSPGTDAPPTSNAGAGQFVSLANPYASAISITDLIAASPGLDQTFMVWDPSLSGSYGYGSFQTFSSIDGYLPHPGGSANYPSGVPVTSLESGQAFFVYSTPGATVNFAESQKTDGSRMVFRGSQANISRIETWLYNQNGQVVDGVMTAFDDSFSDRVDARDSRKLNAFGEGISIAGYAYPLSINARSRVQVSDTIHYDLRNLRTQRYSLGVQLSNMDLPGLEPLLVDRFLNTKTSLLYHTLNQITFDITSDPASKEADRFFIIFRDMRPVPVNSIEISGSRDREKAIRVNWKVEGARDMRDYVLERKGTGQEWQSIAVLPAQQTSTGISYYTWLDEQPLPKENIYRVMARSLDGQIQYSEELRMPFTVESSPISVYPNPVPGRQMTIRYGGLADTETDWNLQLINMSGQLAWSGKARLLPAQDGTALVRLDAGIASGQYQLILRNAAGKKIVLTVQLL